MAQLHTLILLCRLILMWMLIAARCISSSDLNIDLEVAITGTFCNHLIGWRMAMGDHYESVVPSRQYRRSQYCAICKLLVCRVYD